MHPHYVHISVPLPHFYSPLTYGLSEEDFSSAQVGMRVEIPLGRRSAVGFIQDLKNIQPPAGMDIKPISRLIDQASLVSPGLFDLCSFAADYYFSPVAYFLNLCVSSDLGKNKDGYYLKKLRTTKKVASELPPKSPPHALNAEQQKAFDAILAKPAGAFLIKGITGSGKTEIYTQLAQKVLQQHKSTLILVPEIALTSQLQHYFESKLGQKVHMFHSGLSPREKRVAFNEISQEEHAVVLGARSALFAPIKNLGLLVVDEEHDASFKQENNPRYHARDLALYRAKIEGATIVLGSATPSLESINNTQKGKIELLTLTQRAVSTASLPKVQVVDLRSRRKHGKFGRSTKPQSEGTGTVIFSGPLHNGIEQALARNEQVLLLLNQRGYASFTLCEDCGHVEKCPHCSVTLTFYDKKQMVRCHQCGFFAHSSSQCKKCQQGNMVRLGLGTERVEQEAALVFKDARVARLDREVINSTAKLTEVLAKMQNHEIDILVGTQMIAKGHDFQNVSVVGIIYADVILGMPDFRASERTFQLLTQVAGRAGRGKTLGSVFIQTYNPEHPAIQMALDHNVDEFTKLEIETRKLCHEPPFCRATIFRFEGPDKGKVAEASEKAKMVFNQIMESLKSKEQFLLLGPAPAPIERLRNNFRYQMDVRCVAQKTRALFLAKLKAHDTFWGDMRKSRVSFSVDVDPLFML